MAQGPGTPATPLTFKTKLHKALIARPTEDDLKRIKDAGFDGVEGSSSLTPEEAARIRGVADKLGMRIHSVLIDKWSEFNSPDSSVVERSFVASQAALRTAEAFGADTVLLRKVTWRYVESSRGQKPLCFVWQCTKPVLFLSRRTV